MKILTDKRIVALLVLGLCCGWQIPLFAASAEAPAFQPASGFYSTNQTVTITCASPGVAILCTTHYMNAGSMDVRSLTAASHHVDVDYRSSSTSGTAKIKYAHVVAVPLQ